MRLTRTQAAAILGIKERWFDQRVRPAIPASAVKDKPLTFDAAAVVATWVQLKVEEVKAAAAIDDDPLMSSGGESVALERYRLARASMEERKLAQLDRQLVNLELLTEAMRPALRGMKSVGEKLARKFGNEAAEIYNEALERFETALTTAAQGDGDGN